ncbi:MAG TPA: multicopper oxidase family protein [Bryobacteraceae bacterium]|jgi:spore coat protein A|nr:multicopper oxidase family protein [Bryobacteraceae bacterium]
MKFSRRELIGMGAAGLLLPFQSGCVNPKPESRLLPSRAKMPEPFAARLPVPEVLKPGSADATTDYYDVTVKEARAEILPGMQTPIWGYNGTFPGPTIEAQSGRQVCLRLRNGLPTPIVNHLHGGHTPAESDGYPTDFILPAGGFPMPDMRDSLARIAQGQREYTYPNNQRAATLWYHDHRMDFTAPQVWRGLAGFYLLRDDAERKLPLPRAEKDIPLLICDRSFDTDGSLLYPSVDPSLKSGPAVQHEYMGGVLGDVILVNGAPWPRLEVADTKYRLRILNASNARRYELALDPPPAGTSFLQIGSDGGLLGSPLPHRTIRIAPSERFDVVIDFSQYRPGSTVTLVNKADSGPTGRIMRFDVVRHERDESHVPARLADDVPAPDRAQASVTRTFNFSYKRGMQSWTINGKPFDPERMDARPKLGATEIWQLKTDFSHPLHLHLVHFQVLSHSGRPGLWDAGWKDTIDLGPGQAANILVRFSDYRGRYVFHCHNLEHEDMSMMGNFEVV